MPGKPYEQCEPGDVTDSGLIRIHDDPGYVRLLSAGVAYVTPAQAAIAAEYEWRIIGASPDELTRFVKVRRDPR